MVLAIVIVGILSGIYLANKLSAIARYRITAVVIAQSVMEEIIDMEYDQINDTPSESNSLPNGTTDIDVEEVMEDSEVIGKLVRVNVNWEVEGRGYTERLAIFIRAE